jgi:Ser/Thr protein kinase RdoA (MazF antagonist)
MKKNSFIMKKSDNNLLIRYLKKLKIDVLDYERICHENSLSSSIFRLNLKDNSNLILKISFDKKRWEREIYFLDKLDKYILVPKIIDVVEPTPDLNGAVLMQCLSGDIVSPESLSDNLSFKMGELLAKVHLIPCDFYGDFAEKEFLDPSIDNGIAILKGYFDESFEECKNHLDSSLLDKIQKYFNNEIKVIGRLDGPCITHRDFKPGNIIVEKEQIQGLIDWEIAKNHFAEEDFSQMECLVWDAHPKTKQAFLDGYKSIRKLPDLELIMPVLRISKSLGAIGFTIKRKTHKDIHKFVFDKNLHYLQNFFLN